MIRIAIIVAAAENGVIGADGRLPWRLPSDLRHFRSLTLGKPVVMGRKTFQSLGKPLDGRDNIVISRAPAFQPDGVHVATSLAAALDFARACAERRGTDEIVVIGGAEIYRLARPLAGRIYLTRVHARPPGDATFALPEPAAWREIERRPLPRGAHDDYAATLVVFDRISNT